jgi:hypothetical protein
MVVSPTHRPHFIPQKHHISASGIHLHKKLSEFQGLVRPEGLGELFRVTLCKGRPDNNGLTPL